MLVCANMGIWVYISLSSYMSMYLYTYLSVCVFARVHMQTHTQAYVYACMVVADGGQIYMSSSVTLQLDC